MDIEERHFQSDSCIGDALFELKKLQDFLSDTSTPFLGRILDKLIATDTIPVILLTDYGLFEMSGRVFNEKKKSFECFTTPFFRLESIDKGADCARLSLLLPFDINKKPTKCEVIKLAKTPICVEVDLSCICGVQVLSTELLKRKIIIEPKW